MQGPWDVVIVGAGILGLATARELLLRRPGLRLLVLEREDRIAAHQTSHNSGVVHAGLYYPADSLKTALCIEGRRALYAFCETRRVPFRRLGKLVVATSVAETATIEALFERAGANGVEGLELLEGAAVRRLEPDVEARLALHSTQTGIVDAHALCQSLEAEAQHFKETLARWAALQQQRVEAARQAVIDHIEHNEFVARVRELEESLRQQYRRVRWIAVQAT